MPVLRQHHTRDFTVLPNALLQDQRLSCRDRGLLVWMLSKPPEWSFTKAGIVAELCQDGERSVQSGVKVLQELGYLTITRERQKKGTISRSVWIVFDTPQMRNAVVGGSTEERTPQLRYPAVENAAPNKDRFKQKRAVPAVEGGPQLPNGVYFDAESGQWRKGER